MACDPVREIASELEGILPYKYRVRRAAIVDFEGFGRVKPRVYAEALEEYMAGRLFGELALVEPIKHLAGLAEVEEYLVSVFALHAASYAKLAPLNDDVVLVTYGLYDPPLLPEDEDEREAFLAALHSLVPLPDLVIVVDVPCTSQYLDKVDIELCDYHRSRLLRTIEMLETADPDAYAATRLHRRRPGAVRVRRLELYDPRPQAKPVEMAIRELIDAGVLEVVGDA